MMMEKGFFLSRGGGGRLGSTHSGSAVPLSRRLGDPKMRGRKRRVWLDRSTHLKTEIRSEKTRVGVDARTIAPCGG